MKRKIDKNRNINLAEGSITGGIIAFAIPLLLTNLLQQLYNTADLMIVGRFAGKNPMAAVGASGPLSTLLIGLFLGLTTGASVIISIYFGSNDRNGLKKSVETSYFLGIVSGLFITVVGFILTPYLLKMLDTPDEILKESIIYMRIFFLGTTPLLIYNMGASILRATGDSKRPFNFLCVSAVVNIVLDLIFVAMFKMSVTGAGIATLSAQIVSAILVTFNLVNTDRSYRLKIKDIAFHKNEAKKIFEVGIPTGVQSSLLSFTNVIMQAKINTFGSAAIAGVAAESRIDGFIVAGLQAVALAATTFSGQNFGAKKEDRIKHGIKISSVIVLLISWLTGGICFIFAKNFIAIFNNDHSVVSYGAQMLRILAICMWMYGLSETVSGFIRGSGEALSPMIISLITICILRLLWIYIALPMNNSIVTIFLSYPISYGANLIAIICFYIFGKWRPTDKQKKMESKM